MDAPLIAGRLPMAISVVGLLGGLFLLVRRTPQWWRWWVPVAAAAALGAALLTAAVVAVWRPFPDPIPPRILAWIGVFAGACVLAAGRFRGTWRGRVLAVVAVIAVLLTCLMKANAFYGYRPTLNAALDLPAANQVDLATVSTTTPTEASAPGVPVARSWHSPPTCPTLGGSPPSRYRDCAPGSQPDRRGSTSRPPTSAASAPACRCWC